MFRFLDTWFILTCTEGIFFIIISDTHTLRIVIFKLQELLYEETKKKRPLTWNDSSLYMAANPHPCWGPLLKANCHVLGPPPPHRPPSHQCSIARLKDDINMPDSSHSGHTDVG
jgi:hypothetical protein